MARVDNLTNFLNDVATAIKSKTGDSTAIPANQFDTKIMSIQTVGNYETRTLNVVANGSQTITPDTGYDAIESLTLNVSVPIKQLQDKSYEFTQNTNIVLRPETGYDGFSSVNLQINVPGQQINNQNKTVIPTTSQQVISADQGYTGLGNVTVNAVTSSIDQNIVAGNIKDGVSILGVTGNYTGSGDPEYATNLALSRQILGSSLPYTELEYIQATGTQWIDTDYVPVYGDEFEFRNITIPSQTQGTIFWCAKPSANGYGLGLRVYSGNNEDAYFNYFRTDTTQFHHGFITDGILRVTADSKLYYNDTLMVTSSYGNTGDITTNLFLFASDIVGSTPGSGKIGRIIITRNNLVQRTFIPVRRNSDNAICMYELITNTYLVNAGTGSFIAGPEIS